MSIEEEVVAMYNQLPFPDYGDDPLPITYVNEKKYIDLVLDFNGQGYQVYQDRSILDAGCGTGRESMYLASQGARVTAIDITSKSLDVARYYAGRYHFRHPIQFTEGSVLDIPFDNDQFDIVLSAGVIHHTIQPKRAFSELVRVLKPGGYLILFVYNNMAHIIPNLRRALVTFLAGHDIHRRAAIAMKLFPRYVRHANLALIYDEFAHPHKSEHSIAEIGSWFDQFGIKYISVYPKFGFRAYYQNRAARSLYLATGSFEAPDAKFNDPTQLNRISSGILQLIRGYRQYSAGYRFLGLKTRQNKSPVT